MALASGLFNRAMAAVRVVRLTPFDTATEDGRSKERYRRAAIGDELYATSMRT